MFNGLRGITLSVPHVATVYRLAHIAAKAHAEAIKHPDPWKYAYAHEMRHLPEATAIFLALSDPRSFCAREMRLELMDFKMTRDNADRADAQKEPR